MIDVSNLRLYHYYDSKFGPFKNLSDLNIKEAKKIQETIRSSGTSFASKRNSDYIDIRFRLESKARNILIEKGGNPIRLAPHYMTLEKCDWLMEWYENPSVLSIPLGEISQDVLSFTYGDLFPTMRYEDMKPYRKKVYRLNEIIEVIEKYGFPQEWNEYGKFGPERYIEVQVWDEVIY